MPGVIHLELQGKILDSKGKIVGYRLWDTARHVEVSIGLHEVNSYLPYIKNGALVRRKYLTIQGKNASELPVFKVTGNKEENKIAKGTKTDSHKNILGYLKWANHVIGMIYEDKTVDIVNNRLNNIVLLISQGKTKWSKEEFISFLADRVVDKNRRDIEKILFRAGLIEYDIFKIAFATHAINPKDLFWVTKNESMKLSDVLKGTFENIFKLKLDENGSTMVSPDGQNIKGYGISNGKYGLFKKRLHGLSTDAEAEVAVYEISKLLGVDVCPAWFVDKDTIFSEFRYNFTKEFVVHARRYFKDGERTGDLYKDLMKKFPEFKTEIRKMCLLDFITRQDDRHLSNFAIRNSSNRKAFYSLYDNGRSMFHDDNQDMVESSVKDIINYCTTFGNVGTYYDVVEEMTQQVRIGNLINLSIKEPDILEILKNCGYKDYRLEGNLKWIMGTIKLLKTM